MTTGGDTGQDGQDQRPDQRIMRAAAGVFAFVLLGNVLVELGTGTPPTVLHWGFLVVGAVLLGAAAINAIRGVRFPLDLPWVRILAWSAIAALLVSGGTGLVVFLRQPYGPVLVALRGCPHPVELRVVTSPESLAPFQEVADAYERHTAARHRGCQTANLFVYAVPFDGSEGLAAHLVAAWPDEPALIRWPRPDVWLADAAFEVAQVRDQANQEQLHLREAREIGWTPLVLGVPAGPADPELDRRTEQAWSGTLELIEELDLPAGLVRPDPGVSVVGKAAVAAMYAGAEPDEIGEIERRIAVSQNEARYPQGDELAMLCRYRQGHETDPVALVLSEQAMVRFNQDRSPGTGCAPAAIGGELPEQARLVGFYPTNTVELRRQFVHLDWTDTAGPQERAAAEFGDWLDSPAGGAELQRAGLRSDHVRPGDPISEEWGARPLGGWDEPDPDTVASAVAQHEEADRPGRVLVLLDTSGSMAEPVDRENNRFDQASSAVLGTLDRMTDEDEFGLWAFPDEERDRVVRKLVPVGSGEDADERRRRAEAELSRVEVEGGTPVFDAIAQALPAVGETTDQLITAVVAVTDGDDTDSQTTAKELVAEVSREGSPRVFVIATGTATCNRELREVTARSGGLCRAATPDSLDRVLADLVGVLWGGDTG